VIKGMRAASLTLTYDPAAGTLQMDTADPVMVVITERASGPQAGDHRERVRTR